ncbi:serine/threonine-protein kinase [Hyphomonas sp.]|uniref:serine/threonine-protein kinase n=1 Tax=Hyphomonas sp. TaxID=87 RepID=UPI0025C21440|nr:serine/threonine-protein kinase [Hyphomonas sp.]
MDSSDLERQAVALFTEALDQPSTKRHEWVLNKAGENQALLDRVLVLLTADSSGGASLKTGGAAADAAPPKAPERIGAYRITSLIGQGGMGAVYEGVRDSGDFTHKVAIKIIRPGVLSEALIDRFRRERQILADLGHANIARLLDGGELEDGSPYIIMEYIDGHPITVWANEQELHTGDRLELFSEACAAVRFAHQNLIVHRDITPTNVLVTHTGQVKLIDFGIAKPNETDETRSHREAGSESLASLSFTPGFAAPERAQGVATNTLSDIYSLGKLLEALMKGLRTPEDIRAIIRHATKTDPAARYASVDALMEDIQNYRTDHAVDARAGGTGYRIGKFLKRRRLVVAGTSLTFLSLTGALGGSTWQYQRAEAALRDSDYRFQQVRTLAKSLMFDVYDKIDQVPGSTRAKVELAEAAQNYLDSLADDSRASDELKIETARGLVRLSEIQGTPAFSSLQENDLSEQNLDRAEAILKPLEDSEPKSDDLLIALGDLYSGLADTSFYVESDLDKAFEQNAKAQASYAAYLERHPDDLHQRFQLLSMQGNRGILQYRANDRAAAIEIFDSVIATFEELLADNPEDLDLLYGLARTQRSKSEVLVNSDRAVEAVEAASAAIETMAQIRAAIPAETVSYWRALTFTYWRRAYAYYRTGQPELAVEDYKSAKALAERRILLDPDDADARQNLATYNGEIVYPLIDLGRREEAATSLLGATKWFHDRYLQDSGRGAYQRNMLVQHVQLHELYKSWDGHEAQRCHHLDEINRFADIMEEAGTMLESDRSELAAYFEQNPVCGTQ